MKHPVHPGKITRNAIEPTGLDVTESANRLGVNRTTFSRLINEKATLSHEMAARGYCQFRSKWADFLSRAVT